MGYLPGSVQKSAGVGLSSLVRPEVCWSRVIFLGPSRSLLVSRYLPWFIQKLAGVGLPSWVHSISQLISGYSKNLKTNRTHELIQRSSWLIYLILM